MPPEIIANPAVVSTAITTLGVVIVAGFGYLGNRISKIKGDVGQVKKDAAAARYQVENDHIDEHGHPINMRVENDSRHAETKKWFDGLSDQMQTITRDVGGIRAEIRDDRRAHNDSLRALDGRVTNLEQKD